METGSNLRTAKDTLRRLSENITGDGDVTFMVHDVEVNAHKCIIGDRSDMLKAMTNCNAQLMDTKGRHIITDAKITVDDFKNFLRYLYLDECDINYDNLAALLHMSEMYLVPLLKQYCLQFVEKQFDNINGLLQCCELGIICERECPEMLPYCLDALSHTPFQTFTYNSRIGRNRISAELLERIAKDCPRTLALSEDKLLLKIFDWGQQECRHRSLEVNPKGMKAVLSPIVKHMKFERISLRYLLDIVYPNELASPKLYIHLLIDHVNGCCRNCICRKKEKSGGAGSGFTGGEPTRPFQHLERPVPVPRTRFIRMYPVPQGLIA